MEGHPNTASADTWRDRHNRQARESKARHSGKYKERRHVKTLERAERTAVAWRQNHWPPSTLNEWFPGQTRFLTWKAFADEMNVWVTSVHYWRNGTKVPEHKYRRKLFETTGLARYASLECFTRELPKDLPQPFLDLLRQADRYIAPLIRLQNTRGVLFRFLIRCFQELVRNGISNPAAVTPYFVLRHEPTYFLAEGKSGRRKQRWALKHVGTVLADNGYWKQETLQEWRTLVPMAHPPSRNYREGHKRALSLLAAAREYESKPQSEERIRKGRGKGGGHPQGQTKKTRLRIEMIAARKAQNLDPQEIYPDLRFKGSASSQYTRYYGFYSENRSDIDARNSQITKEQAPAIYEASKRELHRLIKSTT